MTKKNIRFYWGAFLLLLTHVLVLLHWSLYWKAEECFDQTYNAMPLFWVKKLFPYLLAFLILTAYNFAIRPQNRFFLGTSGGIATAAVITVIVVLVSFKLLCYSAPSVLQAKISPYIAQNGWILSVLLVFDVMLCVSAVKQRHADRKE